MGVVHGSLLRLVPGDQGTTGTILGAVVTLFLAALTVDYPIRLMAGRELGYVGLPWEFGRREHVEREWVASIDVCYNCGERDVPRVASHAVVDEIEWGLPGRRIESTTTHDCRPCAERLGHRPGEPEPDWQTASETADPAEE